MDRCPHCGKWIDPGDGVVERELSMTRWNEMAKKYGLRLIHRITGKRASSLKTRLRERPDFWEAIERAVGNRNGWAKERRLPTFDQAVSPTFIQKLLEGNYGMEGEEAEENERKTLIEAFQGRRFGTTVATKEGLEGARGVELWNQIRIYRLRQMNDDVSRA